MISSNSALFPLRRCCQTHHLVREAGIDGRLECFDGPNLAGLESSTGEARSIFLNTYLGQANPLGYRVLNVDLSHDHVVVMG